MNYTKTDPTGIDYEVQKLQMYLYNRVIAKWDISESLIDFYGRVYREKRTNGYVPIAYVGYNEYAEVFFNDAKAVTVFFEVGDTITSTDTKKSAQVSINMCINLSLISKFNQTNERMDEEARNDIEMWVDRQYDFFLSKTVIGSRAVLDKYDGTIKDLAAKMTMHPYLIARLDGQLSNYYITFKNI